VCTAHQHLHRKKQHRTPPSQRQPLPSLPSAAHHQRSSPVPPRTPASPHTDRGCLVCTLVLQQIANQKYREGYKCLDFSYPTAKNKMKVTVKAQKETPHPIKVKVCSVSSSLVVLCSNHETTEDTNPHKLTTDCSQFWHPLHRPAEKGSSLTCISYTCSSTAKFVVWLQKQAVESRRDATTEQPAVDHIPPASGLTGSKKQRKHMEITIHFNRKPRC